MVGKKQHRNGLRETHQAQERFARNERAGTEISAGIAKLKNVPRTELPDAAFVLFMAAKQQNELIRRSIGDRLGHDADIGGRGEIDLAGFRAEEAVVRLREHSITSQTFFEWLSEQSSEAMFAVPRGDAVSMVAAMIREQRLEGILEGLRLAGLLNEVPNRRHDGAAMDESRQGGG